MPQYRKKPVAVEARQFDGSNISGSRPHRPPPISFLSGPDGTARAPRGPVIGWAMADDDFKAAVLAALDKLNESIATISAVLKSGAQNAAKDPPSPAQRPVAPSGRG